MLARGNSAYGDREFFGADDRGFESQEDLAEENNRLKQELTRIRRHRSSSFTTHEKFNGPRPSTLGALHGRTQEQLREVIEENDHLNERLKLKEQEMQELAQELQEVREDYTKLREKISEDEHREFEDDDSTEKEGGSKDSPKDVRLFKRHAQDMMKRLKDEKEQDLAKADQAKKLLKMQLEDSQKRFERSKAEVYRMERELSQSEASHTKTKAALQDLQLHYDEVRGMLEGQKDAAEQMRVRVRHLEEELETERLRSSIGTRQDDVLDRCSVDMGGDTLDMLDGYMNPRFTVDSMNGDLANIHGADDKSGADPEISGQLKEQLAELQQECEQLRSQLALAEKMQAQHEASKSAMASSGTAAANAQQELRQECEGLRGRLGIAEGELAEAQRERERLQEQLAQSKEAAEAARRSADSRAGLVSRAEGELAEAQRERERLQEQLAQSKEAAEAARRSADGRAGLVSRAEGELAEVQRERERLQEQLAQSKEAAEAARRSADAQAGLATRAEDLQRECDRLREQQTSVTGELAEAQRERERLQEQLVQSKEAAEAPRRSVDARAGLVSRAEELQRECDRLREQLTRATGELAEGQRERERLQEQLAQSKAATEARRRSADARAGSASRAEELQRECDTLREQLTSTAALASASAHPSQPKQVSLAGTQVEDPQAAASECAQLRQQLAKAEELEQELRQESEKLRRQVAETVELQQQRGAGVASGPALAGAAAPVAVAQEGNRLLAGERAELLKRNEELLHECHDLRQRLQAAESKETAPPTVEELRARKEECAELRERLHTARMAELEAHRKADIVPELMTKIIDLQAQVAAAEKDALDWRELAAGPSWAGMFSSFMCSAPERRPAK